MVFDISFEFIVLAGKVSQWIRGKKLKIATYK